MNRSYIIAFHIYGRASFVSDITAVLRQRMSMCGICLYHINKTFHLSVARFFSTVLSE
jgi:hypothetical protein